MVDQTSASWNGGWSRLTHSSVRHSERRPLFHSESGDTRADCFRQPFWVPSTVASQAASGSAESVEPTCVTLRNSSLNLCAADVADPRHLMHGGSCVSPSPTS